MYALNSLLRTELDLAPFGFVPDGGRRFLPANKIVDQSLLEEKTSFLRSPATEPLTGWILGAVSLADDVGHLAECHSEQNVHEFHRFRSTLLFDQTFSTAVFFWSFE